MIKNEPFSKNLKCKLTTDEKALISERVVELVSKKEEVERQKAAASAHHGGKLKEIWSEIAELSQRHREGEEYREVECYTEFHWDEGVAKVIRSDNFEMISSRVITDNERQMNLDEIEPDANETETDVPQGKGDEDQGSDADPLEDGAGDPQGENADADQGGSQGEGEEGGGDPGQGGENKNPVRDDKELQLLLTEVSESGKKPLIKLLRKLSEDQFNEAYRWARLKKQSNLIGGIFFEAMPEFLVPIAER